VVILNREPRYARAIGAVAAVARALRLALPSDTTVVVTTPSKLPGDAPRNLIRLLRNASLIISPHGAQLAHVLFAPPGAAVLEIQPRRCRFDLANDNPNNNEPNPMYAYISRYAGLHYGILRARNGGVCQCKKECPSLDVDVRHLVHAATALRDLAIQRRSAHLARLRTLLTPNPRHLQGSAYRLACHL